MRSSLVPAGRITNGSPRGTPARSSASRIAGNAASLASSASSIGRSHSTADADRRSGFGCSSSASPAQMKIAPQRGLLPYHTQIVRARLLFAVTLALTVAASTPALAGPRGSPASTSLTWREQIHAIVSGRRISVVIGAGGKLIYLHNPDVLRLPASNEKLLLSMALFQDLGPTFSVNTRAEVTAAAQGGVVNGNLWIVGHGDPEVGRSTMRALADQLVATGIHRIRGRVLGSTNGFARQLWATGWPAHYTLDEVPFPTALAFEGNVGPRGGHIADPETRAAAALTRQLQARGVGVSGRPGAGAPLQPLSIIASVRSAPLSGLIQRMDIYSINFDAEELNKLLGRRVLGPPGTFDEGGLAVERFERSAGIGGFAHHDGSGLSYADRVTARGIVRLLQAAERRSWGVTLRNSLPHAGEGTLEGRLVGTRVRAKTGTLAHVSALSGWVWLQQDGAWGEFSILDSGIPKPTAIRLEDHIVRIVSANAA